MKALSAELENMRSQRDEIIIEFQKMEREYKRKIQHLKKQKEMMMKALMEIAAMVKDGIRQMRDFLFNIEEKDEQLRKKVIVTMKENITDISNSIEAVEEQMEELDDFDLDI